MTANPQQSIPAANYRSFQAALIPGVEGLYRALRAITDAVLSDGASILIVGAGGGREIEALGASPSGYRFLGVDPSPEMLAVAQACVATERLGDRTRLIEGLVDDLPRDEMFDAATALLVMHFIPDDGSKLAFLSGIRARLRRGAAYLHADTCFDNSGMFERMAPVFAKNAVMGGLAPDVAASVVERIRTLPIVSETIVRERLEQSGFRVVAPFFRGLWYAAWWAEAI